MLPSRGALLLVSWAAALALLAGRNLPGALAALALISFSVHLMSLRTAPPGSGSRPAGGIVERSSS
jgi:hypothetical protein